MISLGGGRVDIIRRWIQNCKKVDVIYLQCIIKASDNLMHNDSQRKTNLKICQKQAILYLQAILNWL